MAPYDKAKLDKLFWGWRCYPTGFKLQTLGSPFSETRWAVPACLLQLARIRPTGKFCEKIFIHILRLDVGISCSVCPERYIGHESCMRLRSCNNRWRYVRVGHVEQQPIEISRKIQIIRAERCSSNEGGGMYPSHIRRCRSQFSRVDNGPNISYLIIGSN